MSALARRLMMACASGVPVSLVNASYVQTLDVSSVAPGLMDVFFKPDGTKMFLACTSTDSLHEYALSTAWDLSTASFVRSFSTASQDTGPLGLYITEDGANLYVAGASDDDILRYQLITTWSLASVTFVNQLELSPNAYPEGVFLSPDGHRLYCAENGGSFLKEYYLSTAFDVTSVTASTSIDLSAAHSEESPSCVCITNNGTTLLFYGQTTDRIYEYEMSPYDLSTANFVAAHNFTAYGAGLEGVFVSQSARKMYLAFSDSPDNVKEFSL